MEHLQQVLDGLGVLVVALGILIPALQTLAGVFAKLALLTASKADDDAVSKVSNALNWIASWVARIERTLPRAAFGKPNPVVEATLAAAQIQNNTVRPPPLPVKS